MKGKNKSFIILFSLLLVVALGITYFIKRVSESVMFANAVEIEGYSEHLEGDVIFSVENVYVADSSNRKESLKFEGYDFNGIQDKDDATVYFGNYGLKEGVANKKVVKNHQYVMVDDKSVKTAKNGDADVQVKQAVMITMGGYYFDKSGDIVTTATKDKDGNMGSANIEVLSITAKRNGEDITIPGIRSVNAFVDFVWFLDATSENEGHYELAISYMVQGGNLLRYDFDFYMLLNSSYQDPKTVSGYDYSVSPTLSGVEEKSTSTTINRQYSYFLGEEQKFPTLTFDYTRYNLSYVFSSGDTQKKVDFKYDEVNKMLVLSTSVYNSVKEYKYPILTTSSENSNTIVTLMFAEAGKYTFDFDYVYYNLGQRLNIPTTDLDFANISLDMYGYELMYSKNGFKSAQMQYLEIAQNNTMFILVDGFQSSSDIGSSLGINYTLITSNDRTGTLLADCKYTNILNSKSILNAQIKSDNTDDGFILDETDKWTDDEINSVTYQTTNQGGLWLTLNDNYDLLNSYYYYSTNKLNATFVNEVEGGKLKNIQPITKVATFTKIGYYLVQARYSYKNEAGEVKYKTQYFAFRITSSTPQLNLYKTDSISYSKEIEETATRLYAREFTNKNVFATWAEADVFESKISATLYYSNGKYPTEERYRNFISGVETNPDILKRNYPRTSMITDSGSYMIMLELENTSTRTYTFFTIDKENISGLKVYEVVTNSIDNRASYSIKRDANQNYIDHTIRGILDVDFTLNWNGKNSGAKIFGSYTFTPFVKQATSKSPISDVGVNSYLYVINNYTVGSTSNSIEFSKPRDLNSALEIGNVMATQGIYVFTLQDEAGNMVKYIVILDRTEAIIKGVYGDDKEEYVSGNVVTKDVSITWGTHKAIDISDKVNDLGQEIQNIINGNSVDKYYRESGNNFANLSLLFRKIKGSNLIVVENSRAEIKIQPFDKNDYYVLTSKNEQQTITPNGYTVAGWGELATKLLQAENFVSTGYNLTIKKDEDRLRYYTVSVVSANQISNVDRATIDVCITPDEARGAVYSASQEGVEYETSVSVAGVKASYKEGEEIEAYYEGQASNDGLFVFEWLVSKNNFVVTKVQYHYFELMDQDALNALDSKNKPLYYPYKYAGSEYILNNDEGSEVYNYTTITRKNEEFYRSNPINLGAEVYYDSNNNLVSRNVTRTGLYIITRSIKDTNDNNSTEQDFSYIFFVDRNSIVRYSTSSISEKLVGQFIHNTLPTSEGELHFNNFAIQNLKEYSQTYFGTEKQKQVNYKIYLETNKLPTKLKVPTGKYVSGNIDEKDANSINFTSWNNLKLKLSVYFIDSYNLLPNSSKGAFIRLMDEVTVRKDGYVDLVFADGNQGVIADYKRARIHNEDNSLSLPGTYIFVINDTVGKELQNMQVSNPNEFTFGVTLTKQSPSTSVYAYTQIDSNRSDNSYSVDKTLYTNQGYVDFEIPVEDLNSYDAQLDPYTFEIYRTNNGVKSLWLRVYRSNSGSSYSVDTNGIIQNPNGIIVGVDKNGNVTSETENIVKYVIKLDTGIEETFENGEFDASQVKEYTYSITVKYILKNSDEKYYTYLANDEKQQFCSSTYNVFIDRTPSTKNLDNILESQKTYFEKYENYLESGDENASNKLNVNYRYRSTTTTQDYYALSNRMFYNFVNGNDYSKASESMYAVSVNSNQVFSREGLAGLYYRKIELDSTIDADTRMGLMPICDTYFGNSSGFYSFAEDLTGYKRYSLANKNEGVEDQNGNIYYWAIFEGLSKGEGFDEAYNNQCGVFYEIVEKDLAGNYTQYVIYFEPNEQSSVSLTVKGKIVGGTSEEEELIFGQNKRQTFVGISEIILNNIATGDEGCYTVYYGNINIYNSSNELLEKIYINSKTDKNKLNANLLELLKEERNYIVEYVDIYSRKSYIYIDNYTNTNYSLNTASLVVKTGDNGQKYIELSGVNTKINNDLYCYVKNVDIEYSGGKLSFATVSLTNGIVTLSGVGDSNIVLVLPDRLNLADNTQYLVTLTDVFNITYSVTISTSDEYYPYKITTLPENRVERNNIIYTASMVGISYNNEFYSASVEVYQNGTLVIDKNNYVNSADKTLYFENKSNMNYNTITLNPDEITNPNYEGSVRRFIVKLSLKSADSVAQTYEIYIDTRTTSFNIENANKETKAENVKSILNNEVSGQDYDNNTLIQDDYYGTLLNETVTISWSRLQSDYFTYKYELLEFTTANSYINLLQNSTATSYKISPKDKNTTGKYVFKVLILADDGRWIATRIFTINMSTTLTGLYAVKHNDQEFEYSTTTNFSELKNLLSLSDVQKEQMSKSLKFDNVTAMENAFTSFGDYTAIPMYISTLRLELHSNKDNGVDEGHYELGTGTVLYHVFKSNYRTFVLIMQVAETDNILTNFTFSTKDGEEPISLLDGKTSRTIYDSSANYYRLNFNSYNKNSQSNGLEKYNKILIEVYYNGEKTSEIQGGSSDITTIEFKNGGNYTLKVKDLAGNVQIFGSINKLDNFTIVLMKELLYTINDNAPIQYAYYDQAVTLKINKSNSATGENNYDGNTIKLTAYLNNSSEEYRGYTKLANSYVYIFEKYGTYLIEMTANLYSTGEQITSRIVFTILNPNEARTAMDFTSIYSYNIKSVYDISKSVQKDVTERFVSLLADKSNQAGSNLYNKLITYERLAEAFGTTQGKMKFKVVYEANDDALLPVRTVEFAFTLNNEPPTISCSIESGKKTTKPVTIKFNAAILYSQLGECYIVVNGNMDSALKINENSANEITQIQVEEVGNYYIQVMGDSGNIATSFNFTIKEPLNVMSIILIVVVVLIVIAIVGTFIWLRTRMKVR